MKWVAFWVFKYLAAVVCWYCYDDAVAAHFSVSALGTVPAYLVVAIVLFISFSSEQYSVMRAHEVGS